MTARRRVECGFATKRLRPSPIDRKMVPAESLPDCRDVDICTSCGLGGGRRA